MTGPADDAELVVKMLNSGAPGVMLDLEDSTANTWENLERGLANILEALAGRSSTTAMKNSTETAQFTKNGPNGDAKPNGRGGTHFPAAPGKSFDAISSAT